MDKLQPRLPWSQSLSVHRGHSECHPEPADLVADVRGCPSEWWALARLRTRTGFLKELVARRPMGGVQAPPGPPPGAPGVQHKGTFDENDLAGSMPSIDHPMRDGGPWLE